MKIKFFLFSLLFLIVFSQCKKDYPSDIPKWLEEIIIKAKRNNYRTYSGQVFEINEYTKDDTLVFLVPDLILPRYYIYDLDGNKLCTIRCIYDPDMFFSDCGFDIPSMPPPYLKFIRNIWTDNSNKSEI